MGKIIYKITPLGKKELQNSDSVYLHGLSKEKIEVIEEVIEKVLVCL